MSKAFQIVLIVAVVMCMTAMGPTAQADKAAAVQDAKTTAAAAVARALRAESDGNSVERQAALAEALAAAPQHPAAHWHSGEVQLQGKWRTVADCQREALQNKALTEYALRRLALQAQPTAEGEYELATWCRKNKLETTARAHWFNLLSFEPGNPQALKELGLFNYNGELLTHRQWIERKKVTAREQRAFDHWKPRLATWRRELDDNDKAKRDGALDKIRKISDPDAIFAFEHLLQTKDEHNTKSADFSREMVAVLGTMCEPQVSEALVRQAARSIWPETRDLAIEELKKRDLIEFVPYALVSMQAPLKMSHRIAEFGGNVYYEQVLWREGPEVDDRQINRAVFVPKVESLGAKRSGGKDDTPSERAEREDARAAREAEGEAREKARRNAERRAQQDEAAVSAINAQAEEINAALRLLLARVTGEDQGAEVSPWWDWWIHYNELNYPPFKPVRSSESWSFQIVLVQTHTKCCFLKGTPVATLTGFRAIEGILPGDQVLSQNSETGELAFKAVLAVGERPAVPLYKISHDKESVVATGGHRFWVDGRGWKMAKHLAAGDRLHAPTGALPIEAVEQIDDQPAYSLTVDDFHTYFVGDTMAMVHDNQAPRPVLGPVPGLEADDVQPVVIAKPVREKPAPGAVAKVPEPPLADHAAEKRPKAGAKQELKLTLCRLTGKTPFRVGEVITIDCGLKNASGRVLTVPVVKSKERPARHNIAFVGGYQFYLERLGDNAEIVAWNQDARDGKRYAAGGADIASEPQIARGAVIKFQVAMRLDTKALPAGKYRFDVEYSDRNDILVDTQSALFELLP